MAKEESYQQVVDWVIRGVKDNGIDKKYNIDAIVHCFRNGIKNYLNRFSIITSYEEIGKTFECLYEIEQKQYWQQKLKQLSERQVYDYDEIYNERKRAEGND